MRKRILGIFLALGMLLSGCSMFQKQEDVKEEKKEDLSTIVIGDKTENSRQVTLINDTGDKIVGLFIKKTGEENYKNNLLAEEGAMDRKDKRLLNIENNQDTYEMTILVNQKNYVLHDIPFHASNTFEIHLGEEYGYVIYNDGNNVVSTEEAEKNRINPPEEEVVEEIVEEAPAEQTYDPNAAYNNNYNANNNYYYYEEPVQEQPVVVPERPVEQPVEQPVVEEPVVEQGSVE